MTREEKESAKQQAVAGALLNTALDRLNELAAPYVLMIGGQVLSNQPEHVARVVICDAANLLDKIQDMRVEQAADRIVNGFGDDGNTDTKAA